VPEKKTVCTIEYDTMGMGKMLKETLFVTNPEKIDNNKRNLGMNTHNELVRLHMGLKC
jgi:hypothetical protein